MAYRRSNGKGRQRSRKLEPAVQTFEFITPSVTHSTTGTFYVDLSQCASILNRRFYRQGLTWAVSSIKVGTAINSGITVSKLPNTWVMSNAWEKGFHAWKDMNDGAIEENEGSIRPRYLDFKIYADALHHEKGFAGNMIPVAASGVQFVPPHPDTWSPSKVVVPFGPASPGNTTDFEILATGPNFPGASPVTGTDAVSLIEGYAASRALPAPVDPNVPADADDADGSTPENWIVALRNEGIDQDSEVIADLISENNKAPYPFEGDGVNLDTMYPGGANQGMGLELHDRMTSTDTTIGGYSTIQGGLFPCGLVRFDMQAGDTSGNFVIQINLVPGPHKGYMAQNYQEA